MATSKSAIMMVAVVMVLPLVSNAQGPSGDVRSLHAVLDQLYLDMMPLCSRLIGVGRGLAGFAAIWYIASRVWRHLANAEPIDFYPLFRPFGIGFAVMIVRSVLDMINGVIEVKGKATAEMVNE